MSFLMTHRVNIEGFKPLKVNSLKWSRSIDSYCDTASIIMPAICRMKKNGDAYDRLPTSLQFKEGTPVEILAGYDYKNVRRFKGFITRINYSIPLEVECEGYSYQLRKLQFTKSYSTVTLEQLLTDLLEGTDIKLSSQIPKITFTAMRFPNVRRIAVLEHLKRKCGLTVNFDYDVLYAGLEQIRLKPEVKFRLGWNTIKDEGLQFETSKELADVIIRCEARLPDGKKVVARSSNYQRVSGGKTIVGLHERVIRISSITTPAELQKIADRKRTDTVFQGYEGTILAFAEPYAEPGMTAVITNSRYPERTGKYFIDKVTGSFGEDGGRQQIHIGNSLSE